MFSFIQGSVFAFSGLICLHEYIRNQHPEYYQHICEDTFCMVLWHYSSLQIKFIKYKPLFEKWIDETCPFLIKVYKYFEVPEKCIEYVKDGDVVYSCTKQQYHPDKIIDCDFIVYTNGIDKILYYKEPGTGTGTGSKNIKPIFVSSSDSDEQVIYDYSSTKLLLVEMNFKNNERLGIKFKNAEKKYNYMIAGNRVNCKFLTYFLRKHYLDEIFNDLHMANTYSLEGVDYTLTTLDDNTKIRLYGPNDEFLF